MHQSFTVLRRAFFLACCKVKEARGGGWATMGSGAWKTKMGPHC